MNSITKNVLPSCIEDQKKCNWILFSEQHPNSYDVLLEKEFSDFQLSLALSDFILNSALQSPRLVIELFRSGSVYETATPDYQQLLNTVLIPCKTEDELHKALRDFRRQEMVKIAVGDLLLNLSLDESLQRLSLLADAFILETLKWLSTFCYQQWGKPVNNEGELQPLLVYGMGKLGGKELNFSSDIDLIFVYPESGNTLGARRSLENHQFFTRLAQKLITALHKHNGDGFVYRVDMRLRPFGDSGPLVLSFSAVEDYYQEQGRDWERYAMLKARLIGDSSYHQQLASMLKPFVFRRYIDFSVIDSLRRMKSMIAQEVKRKHMVNNIKLGAGGIREIEFIVQVFQLLRGGQVPELQQRNLLKVLPLLVKSGEIAHNNAQVLETAYRFLRRTENIIQALGDQQTQTLPESELDQARLVYALGLAEQSWDSFLVQLNTHMNEVHEQFCELIGEETPNGKTQDTHWITLWDSQWDLDESMAWIAQHQENWNAEVIWRALLDFRESLGSKRIGQRGRQVLDKLIPLMLTHLSSLDLGSQTQLDEMALPRMLSILEKILTRTTYLELLYENEGALAHLIKLSGSSSWITEHIAKHPILLDELIDPKLLHNPPALTSYAHDLRENLLRVPEDDLEAQMNKLRQFKQVQQLRIAAADISGVLNITKVSDHLTALAEGIIAEVINIAWQNVALRFGIPQSLQGKAHKGFAVIGYGKMGGVELGYSSDLDLVFLHESLPDDMTDGGKEVTASQFYRTLAQRIMHIFNTRMSSGMLYELDMRLRPSGNSGLMVVHIDSFERYQKEEAWTWEHQALVRTRIVYGHTEFVRRYNKVKKDVLSSRRDANALLVEVMAMRKKMRAHLDKSTDSLRDIKQGEGGLVDIEFLVQYLVLKHAKHHPQMGGFSDNIRILDSLAQHNIISLEQQKSLTQAYCQLRDLGHRATLRDEKQQIPIEVFMGYAKNIKEIAESLMQ